MTEAQARAEWWKSRDELKDQEPEHTRPDGAGPVPLADDFEPLPPPDGIDPAERHPTLGLAVGRYVYRDAKGRTEGFVCHYETPDGKETRPLRYGRRRGRDGWYWKGWPSHGRPAYRLPEALARPHDPVLVLEGEKTADAAAELLPEFAAVTSMGGSKAADHTDWSWLRGRRVVVLPDVGGGVGYAAAVGKIATAADAAAVRVVRLPPDAPLKWDVADEAPAGWGDKAEAVRGFIKEAPTWRPGVERQGRFMVRPRWENGEAPGVYHEVELKEGEREWRWLSSLVEVVAFVRDDVGEQWGRLLRITDPEGRVHEWAMASSMLAGDGTDHMAHILSLGARLASGRGARTPFNDYLAAWQPGAWARCVDRVGWHSGDRFVLPDRTFGGRGEAVVLQTAGSVRPSASPARLRAGNRRSPRLRSATTFRCSASRPRSAARSST